MQISLCNESLDVPLAYIKLTVLGQCYSPDSMVSSSHETQVMLRLRDSPVLCLDFTCILEYSHVDEQVSWRLQAPRQVDVCPLPLVGCQQVAVLSDILLFLRAETTL